MEPVFMVLGQSAATAASLSIAGDVAVQDVPYEKLRARLLEGKQVLEWKGGAADGGRDVKSLDGFIIDDPDARFTGEWVSSRSVGGFVGGGYRHNQGTGTAAFTFRVPSDGSYDIGLSWTGHPNRAKSAKVSVAGGSEPVVEKNIDQRAAAGPGGFRKLATRRLKSGDAVVVTVQAVGEGFTIADAVQILRN
jgi:hypothetical protein